MTILPATNASGAGRHRWAPTNSAILYSGDGGVCVLAQACACARARVRACARDVSAIYDNNI